MGVSAKYIRPLPVIILWELWCLLAPLLFFGAKADLKIGVWDFNNPESDELGWFMADTTYILAMILYASVSYIKDEDVRKLYASVLIAEALREYIDIIFWDNQFNLSSVLIQTAFFIGYIVYASWKLKRSEK